MVIMSLSDSDTALWLAYVQGITRIGHLPQPAPRPIERSLPQGRRLDLHGLTVHEAHGRTMEFLTMTRRRYRYVIIITGLSGAIRREFRHWLDSHPIRQIEELRGGGSFRVYFSK